jgi:hypothetical protein
MRLQLRRLLTNPRTRILSRDGDVTRVQVEGLVCDRVCAARTASALRRVDGVRDVCVDFDTGVATVIGAPAPAVAYERAVTSAVAGRPVRRLIERVARTIRHREERAA